MSTKPYSKSGSVFGGLKNRCAWSILIVLGMVASAAHLEAAIYVWDGGGANLNWGTGANWVGDVVPPNAGHIVQFNGGAGAIPANASVTLSGNLYPNGTTEWNLNNGAGFTIGGMDNYIYFGSIKVQDAFAYTINSANIGLAISGTGRTIDVVSGGSLTIDKGITVGSFGTATITKTGAGTLYLTGGIPTNTSTLNTTIQGGILSTASVNNLGTGHLAVQLGGTFQYTGTGAETRTAVLFWNNGSAIFDVTSPTAELTLNATGGTRNGPLTKSGAGTLILGTTATHDGTTLTVTGGKLVLQANNTFSGATNVSAGSILNIQHANALGQVGNGTVIANMGVLEIQGGITTALEPLQLSGTGISNGGALRNVLNDNTFRGNIILAAATRINSDSGTLTLNSASAITNPFALTLGGEGNISLTSAIQTGANSLTKDGGGTATLGGINTYTGVTAINGGTLALTAAGTINNTSGVVLANGTFNVSAKGSGYAVNNLSGNGSVVGALTVNGNLAIGASPGIISFDSLTLASSSIYNYELTGGGSTADLGNISNLLTLSNAALDLEQLGAYTTGDKFTLFAYPTGNLSGSFAGLANGDIFADAGGFWRINYADSSAGLNGGTGTSFVTITAIPEPSTLVFAGLGILGFAGFRLRRNRLSA